MQQVHAHIGTGGGEGGGWGGGGGGGGLCLHGGEREGGEISVPPVPLYMKPCILENQKCSDN